MHARAAGARSARPAGESAEERTKLQPATDGRAVIGVGQRGGALVEACWAACAAQGVGAAARFEVELGRGQFEVRGPGRGHRAVLREIINTVSKTETKRKES